MHIQGITNCTQNFLEFLLILDETRNGDSKKYRVHLPPVLEVLVDLEEEKKKSRPFKERRWEHATERKDTNSFCIRNLWVDIRDYDRKISNRNCLTIGFHGNTIENCWIGTDNNVEDQDKYSLWNNGPTIRIEGEVMKKKKETRSKLIVGDIKLSLFVCSS